MKRAARAVAHSNVALAKYWGKANEELMLPATPSISITLDKLSTETTVEILEDPACHEFSLDGERVDSVIALKYCDYLRDLLAPGHGYSVSTRNSVLPGIGMGSSSSAYCSIAGAFYVASGKERDDREISTLARMGSISSSRSVYSGFVLLNTSDTLNCYPEVIEDKLPTFSIVSIKVDSYQKQYSSREGMKIATTSPRYSEWLDFSRRSTEEIRRDIEVGDLESLGKHMEENFLFMDLVNRTSERGFSYLNNDSHRVIDLVHRLRERGLEVWYTFDAGPNPFILCAQESTGEFIDEAMKALPTAEIVEMKPGPGLEVERV